LDIIWSLENVDVQASTDVPRDVAMHWPDTGVVLIPLEHNVTRGDGSAIKGTRLHELNVTSLGVVCIGNRAVPFTNTFSKNVEIMTVKMDRMSKEELVLED